MQDTLGQVYPKVFAYYIIGSTIINTIKHRLPYYLSSISPKIFKPPKDLVDKKGLTMQGEKDWKSSN